ncbi:unnamed protein product [Allacma fusca]|uniref:Uncharacterized protein n=1 Tax=Allacma fusca TaxID=39272 RepID=A0A8J2J6U0_9HEXA|nr:unnamed protein product [Allacma fusca]
MLLLQRSECWKFSTDALLASCSLAYIYADPADLAKLSNCFKNSRIPFRIQLLNDMNATILPHYQFSNVPKWRCNCNVVLVLNVPLRSLTLQNYIYTFQRPKRDIFMFLNQLPLSTPFWFNQLRFKVQLTFYAAICSRSETNPTTMCEDYSLVSLLNGDHLRVTSFVMDPYVVLENGSPVRGCFYNLILHSSKYYNFTLDMDYPMWRGENRLPNGTWAGSIGKVLRGERDMVLGSGLTIERELFLDFTTFIDQVGLMFTTSHPQISIDSFAIIYIFQPTMWLYLFLCCLSIFVVVKLSGKIFSNKYETTYLAFTASFNPLIQGGILSSNIYTIKFITHLWMFVSLVIGTYYNSDFIAYITYPTAEKIPRTFLELARRFDYKIKLLNLNAADVEFFNETRNPTFLQIRERLVKEDNWIKCLYSAGVEKKTACITFEGFGVSLLSKNLTISRAFSVVQFSADSAISFQLGIGFPKNSKYVDAFSDIVRYLRDTGHIRKWTKDVYEFRKGQGIRWMSKRSNTSEFHSIQRIFTNVMGSPVQAFQVKNVLLCFVILLLGLFLALVSFGAEFTLRAECIWYLFRFKAAQTAAMYVWGRIWNFKYIFSKKKVELC